MVEGNSTNTCIRSFSFLVAESSKAKQLLPIEEIGIVAYAFTLCGTTFVETALFIDNCVLLVQYRVQLT